MSLIDFRLALYYSMETYVRRDTAYVIGKIFDKNPDRGQESVSVIIPQPEIEEWIKEQYN